jgi:hypothetical protein
MVSEPSGLLRCNRSPVVTTELFTGKCGIGYSDSSVGVVISSSSVPIVTVEGLFWQETISVRSTNTARNGEIEADFS